MIYLFEDLDFNGFNFVLPSVSVGNVGQLAVDLLITSLKLTKIGHVHHPAIIPVTGNNPYNSEQDLALACELYWSQPLQLVVLQVRSGFGKRKREFVKCLVSWLKLKHFDQVVVLTGAHAHERIDKQLVGEPLRFIFSPLMSPQLSKSAIERGWLEYERKEGKEMVFQGAGITSKIYEECLKQQMPCAVLVEFCSDGNNIPDAIFLSNYLDSWLQLKQSKNWVFPPSWNLLFGSPPPIELS